MTTTRHPKGRSSPGKAGWLLFVVLVTFTLSIGTVVHNHGIFGTDGGAEKISQSKFTCPACVFDGKPMTFSTTSIVLCDAGLTAEVVFADVTFESLLGETASSRAPPAI